MRNNIMYVWLTALLSLLWLNLIVQATQLYPKMLISIHLASNSHIKRDAWVIHTVALLVSERGLFRIVLQGASTTAVWVYRLSNHLFFSFSQVYIWITRLCLLTWHLSPTQVSHREGILSFHAFFFLLPHQKHLASFAPSAPMLSFHVCLCCADRLSFCKLRFCAVLSWTYENLFCWFLLKTWMLTLLIVIFILSFAATLFHLNLLQQTAECRYNLFIIHQVWSRVTQVTHKIVHPKSIFDIQLTTLLMKALATFSHLRNLSGVPQTERIPLNGRLRSQRLRHLSVRNPP